MPSISAFALGAALLLACHASLDEVLHLFESSFLGITEVRTGDSKITCPVVDGETLCFVSRGMFNEE